VHDGPIDITTSHSSTAVLARIGDGRMRMWVRVLLKDVIDKRFMSAVIENDRSYEGGSESPNHSHSSIHTSVSTKNDQ
jgi:hypothetical protein